MAAIARLPAYCVRLDDLAGMVPESFADLNDSEQVPPTWTTHLAALVTRFRDLVQIVANRPELRDRLPNGL